MLKLIHAACLMLIVNHLYAATPLNRMTSHVPGSRGTVLIFVSSMCPCTDQHKLEVRQLVSLTRSRGIGYYCVFSNIVESDARVGQFFKNVGWDMPYILDAEGTMAKRFGATHTPQVIVLNQEGKPVFRGPIDDSSRNLGRIEHAYLRDSVNRLLEGKDDTFVEVPPLGCWLVTVDDLKK